jgi:hypothetical protein
MCIIFSAKGNVCWKNAQLMDSISIWAPIGSIVASAGSLTQGDLIMILFRRLGPKGLLTAFIISVAIIAGIGLTIFLLDQREKTAITPEDLFKAVNQGEMTRVIECLKAKPQLANAKDSTGRTPLHIAAGRNMAETAQLLLQMGADPSLENADGKTPLEVARENNSNGVAEILGQAESE